MGLSRFLLKHYKKKLGKLPFKEAGWGNAVCLGSDYLVKLSHEYCTKIKKYEAKLRSNYDRARFSF